MRQVFYLILLLAISWCTCLSSCQENGKASPKKKATPNKATNNATATYDNTLQTLGAGYYRGVITAGTYKVNFEVDIFKNRKNRLVGAYFSDDQQAFSWPIITVRVDSNILQFDLPTDVRPMHFFGTLENDTIKGKTWVIGDERQYARFQLWKYPKPKYKEFYTWEEVKVENGEVTIAGTLRRPANTDAPCPAIVFMPTEGEDRNDHAYFADYFAKQGFVTFHYDKRGTGRSTGDWRKVNHETLATDDLKVIEMVMGVNIVDPERVGVFAKGLGSARLPLVMHKNEEIAFGVGVSTPGYSLLETEFQFKQKVIKDNISDPKEVVDAFAFLRMQYDYAISGKNWDELKKLADASRNASWYSMIQLPNDPNHWVFDMIRKQLDFNSIEYWKQIRQPILLIQGQYDDYIQPEAFDEISKALAEADNQMFLKSVIARADHAMWNVYDDLPLFMVGQASKQYRDVVSDWVRTVVGERH